MKTSCHPLQYSIQITLIFYSAIESLSNCLKNNNISGFHNIKFIQSKWQPTNLKKFLTKAEYGEILLGLFNNINKRCQYCNYLLLVNNNYKYNTNIY